VAARLLKDGKIPRDLLTAEVDNGAGKIPSSLLQPKVITAADIPSLIKDGWVTKEEVYKDVPADRRPSS
jgi:ABC-type xylose transport system substrate-binding protein